MLAGLVGMERCQVAKSFLRALLVAALALVLLPGGDASKEHGGIRGRRVFATKGITHLNGRALESQLFPTRNMKKGHLKSRMKFASKSSLDEGGDSKEEAHWLLVKDKEGLPVLVIIFLVFGFVCMTVGAIFSLVMAVQYDGDADLRPMGPVYYYLIFFVASVSALSYYSMWSETVVLHVHDGEVVRIVFPARYLDWAVTSPLMLVGVGLLGNAALPAILGMVGSDLIMIGCLYTAAMYAPAHKYFWFGVSRS